MAVQQPGSGLSGFSLTGNLTLQSKSKSLFKGHGSRSFWFWFDEQSCSLKYYRSRDTYSMKVNEPLGRIDLRYAKVTPGITSGYTNKQFQISVNQQFFLLTAGNDQEALNWIEKLQEKRSEYIKMSSAMEENAQEQEKERKAFRPLNTQPASVLAAPDVSSSPPSVRKIFSTRLHGSTIERQSVNVDAWLGASAPIPTPHEVSDITPLEPVERQRLELETKYLEVRGEADQLRRELIKMNGLLESRDKEVVQLRDEVAQLKEELAKRDKPQSALQLEVESLQNVLDQYKRSLKTLDEEINLHRLNQAEHDKRISSEKTKLADTEKELLRVKAKYIRLLSDKFKPAIQGQSLGDEDDMGEEASNAELVSFLVKESGDHPLFGSYRESFEDQYGDVHDWSGGVTTQLYLCRQLFLHYTTLENEQLVEEWVGYLAQIKRSKGKQHMELPVSGERSKKRELRNLLRKGLPLQFRTKVWSSLIMKIIGRIKEVRDTAAGKDGTYYQSLLKVKHNSPSEKQIRLDLYRTLPSNVHFQRGGNGAPKLENVLLAYSLHNKNVGYCQGMNMLAAIGLLFLDEELDFWFLVAVIDKLMPPHYFSPGLLGPQADQAVVSELVAEKLPRLYAHLQRYSIDVTLVTFNWFLTLFVDALPTETVFRILDCFLLEGTKVLFRMSLGILTINEKRILGLTDPVALFQFLKEVARHTYDIEALFQAAYVDLNPFPSRSHLSTRHQHHFTIVREQWTDREKQRAKNEQMKAQSQLRDLAVGVRSLQPTPPERRRLVWETGCVHVGDEIWMACTEDQQTHVTVIKGLGQEVEEKSVPEVGSRVICMYYVASSDMVLLGTLDFHIHAVHCQGKQHLWSLKLNDSVLAIVGQQTGCVFAAMADGCVAVIQDVSHSAPQEEPLLVRIGSNSAVQCLTLNTKKTELWCGCGRAITVLSTDNLEAVQSVSIPDQASKIYKMERGSHGVWTTFRNASLICLYDCDFYIKLLQVDYATLVPQPSPLSTDSSTRAAWELRITSLLSDEGKLWLGTGSGSVYLFSVVTGVANPSLRVRALANKQAGVEHVAEFRNRVGSGGLLSSVVEGEADENHLERRRKTNFGYTFRGGARKRLGANSPDVYKLVFVESHQSYPNSTEPVRTLLSIGGECVVSCVNCLADWQQGVQFWTRESSTNELVCQYLHTEKAGVVLPIEQ